MEERKNRDEMGRKEGEGGGGGRERKKEEVRKV